MRLILTGVLLSLALCSVKAMADLPSVDPVIAKLRDEFATARVPVLADLRINQAWGCTDFDAWAGSSNVETDSNAYKFRSVNGIIVNDGVWSLLTYAFTKDGLSQGSSDAGIRYRSTIRVLSGGSLIVEFAKSPASQTHAMPISLIDPNFFVTSYSICTP